MPAVFSYKSKLGRIENILDVRTSIQKDVKSRDKWTEITRLSFNEDRWKSQPVD